MCSTSKYIGSMVPMQSGCWCWALMSLRQQRIFCLKLWPLPQPFPNHKFLAAFFTAFYIKSIIASVLQESTLFSAGEMEGLRSNGSVSALPPPRPKTPPEYPDLYGKRRELAKIQMMEREIGFLEEELKSADGFQPASRTCKEVVEFATSNADPLMPTSRIKEIRRPHGFEKWLCGLSCFNVSMVCTPDPEIPQCSKCRCSSQCVSCRVPKLDCDSCLNTRCLNKSKCCWSCCNPKLSSCLTCFCSSTFPKCLEVNCCFCYKKCCYRSYFCY